jgi:hypothetical protein
MATINLTKLVLKDNWPGIVNLNAGKPNYTPNSKCGWDNTNDNFCTADATARALNKNPTQRIGEKRAAYQESTECPGWYTMMYLCLHSFEDGMDISKDFSDGNFFHGPSDIGCISTSEWADTSVGPWFVVSRCTTGADVTRNCAVAIPCSTYMHSDGTRVGANGYGDGYGWFWVGGVCPCKDITLFDDETGAGKGIDFTCDEDVARGPVFLCQTGAAAWLMSCDPSNIFDNTTGVVTMPDPGALAIGWVCDSAA